MTLTPQRLRTLFTALFMLASFNQLGFVGSAHAQETQAAPEDAASEEAESSTRDRDEEARLHFQIGERALTDGRYEEALAQFQRSYELSQRPELLFNIGVAHDRLRNDQEALESYRAFLEALPNASNRNDAERRVEILEREVTEAEEGPDLSPENVANANTDAELALGEQATESEASESGGSKWWLWTIIGVVVVGAAVGVGIAASQDRTIEAIGPYHETLSAPRF